MRLFFQEVSGLLYCAPKLDVLVYAFSFFVSAEISWIKIQIRGGGTTRGVFYPVCLVTSLQIIHALLEPRSHSTFPPGDGRDWICASLIKRVRTNRSSWSRPQPGFIRIICCSKLVCQDQLLRQTGLSGPAVAESGGTCQIDEVPNVVSWYQWLECLC